MGALGALLNIAPVLSVDNEADLVLSNTKNPSQGALGYTAFSIQAADFYNLLHRQFGSWPWPIYAATNLFWMKCCPVTITASTQFWMKPERMSITSWYSFWMRESSITNTQRRSPLLRSICKIVFESSSEQMVSIATRWVVASVAGQKWERVFPGMQKKRYVMRHPVIPLHAHAPIGTKAEEPGPAFVRSTHIYVRPESRNIFFGKRWEWSTISLSHVISFQIALVRAVAAFPRYSGSFHSITRGASQWGL